MGNHKVIIIIPAYNEEHSIREVIGAVRKTAPKAHLLVINDCSTDQTKRRAQEAGAEVLNLPFNLGIGGAVQAGLKYAHRHGYNWAIQIDADGQHDPRFIPPLLAAAKKSGADLTIGSRYLKKTNYHSSWQRRLGVIIFSALIRAICRKDIKDSTSGYRVYGRRALAFLSRNYPIDFPEPESIVRLLRNRFRIKEVPVEMKPRAAGKSSVGALKAIYLMISISIAILIESLKTYPTYESRAR